MKSKQTSQKQKWENVTLCLPFSNDKTGYGNVKRWEKMKEVGFKRFLFYSTLGWLAFFLIMQIVIHLIELRLPTQEGWIACIVIYTGLGAILSLIKWKGYEYKCSHKESAKSKSKN